MLNNALPPADSWFARVTLTRLALVGAFDATARNAFAAAVGQLVRPYQVSRSILLYLCLSVSVCVCVCVCACVCVRVFVLRSQPLLSLALTLVASLLGHQQCVFNKHAPQPCVFHVRAPLSLDA
jgi:hypothetical protein